MICFFQKKTVDSLSSWTGPLVFIFLVLISQCMCVYMCVSCSIASDSLQSCGLVAFQATLSIESPGKNAGVGCHSLLQEICLTQGLNAGLLHCRQFLYCLNHQ